MEVETRKERVQRIISKVRQELGFRSVQKFADAIGAGYMQVYYCETGKVNEVSEELIEKITTTFDNVNPEFLRTGYGDIIKTEDKTDNESFSLDAQITNGEIVKLIDRLVLLLEKVQAREERLEEKCKRVEELENKLTKLLKETGKD